MKRPRLRHSFGRILGAVALVSLLAGCTSVAGTPAPPVVASAEASPAATSAQPSVTTTQVMARGSFHGVDGSASGEAQLVVTPSGMHVVALESFKISSIDHVNLVLVSNASVAATADIDKTKLLDLGPLKAAEGMQDFPIPADMASGVTTGYHSAVLWDTAMAHAIAAAPLQ